MRTRGRDRVGTYVFDDHDQEGQLYRERFVGVGWAGNETRGDVQADDLEHAALDIGVSDALDVAVSYLLVPNLKRLGPGWN